MITPEKLHTNEVGGMGEEKGHGTRTGQDGTAPMIWGFERIFIKTKL